MAFKETVSSQRIQSLEDRIVKLETAPFIERIQVLKLEPTDTLIFRPHDEFYDYDPEVAERLKTKLGVKAVLFVPKNFDIEVQK